MNRKTQINRDRLIRVFMKQNQIVNYYNEEMASSQKYHMLQIIVNENRNNFKQNQYRINYTNLI